MRTSAATRGSRCCPRRPSGRSRCADAATTSRSGCRSGRCRPTTSTRRSGAASPSSTSASSEIDTAPLPGTPSLIGWQSVANIIYIAGFDESSRAASGVDRPAHRQRRQPERRLRGLRHDLLRGEPLAMAFDVSDHDQDEDHARLLVSVTAEDGSGSLVQIDAGSNAFAWRLAGIGFGSVLVGADLPAGGDHVQPPPDRRAGGHLRGGRRHELRDEPHQHERHLRGGLHRRRLPRLLAGLVGPMAAQRLVGAAAGRRPDRPGGGHQVGGHLRHAGHLDPGVRALGARPLPAGGAERGDRGGDGLRRAMAVPGGALATLALALVVVWVRPIQLEMRDLLGLSATMAVLAAVGLAFTLAFNQVEGAREPGNAVELVFSVLARAAQVGWPAWICCWPDPRCCWCIRAVRSLSDPDSDRRWQLPGELGGFQWPWIGSLPGRDPAARLLPGVRAVPAARPQHRRTIGRSGLRLVIGRDARPDVRLPLRPAGRASFVVAVVELAPRPEAGLVLRARLRRAARRRSIYNGGNPILFWAGVPALIWCGLMAWKRRSLALVLLVVAFAFQFLPWTRIERATFHYHYLTAVIFAMVAVPTSWTRCCARGRIGRWRSRSWCWRRSSGSWSSRSARPSPCPTGTSTWPDPSRPGTTPSSSRPPPQGERGQLIAADSVKLIAGVLVAVSAAAFALYGRELLGGGPSQGEDEQDDAQGHERYRPQQVGVDGGHVLVDQEPDPEPDQDHAEDHGTA